MSKTTESKTFKQLKAVMKDVNGDNRQIKITTPRGRGFEEAP